MARFPNYGSFGEKEAIVRQGEDVPVDAPSKLENWMSRIDDETLLSALSIPGTHDSAAFTTSWPFISTQRMDAQQQLNAGIRYFDFRCGAVKDVLEMVHGSAILGLRLEVMLDTMYTWLDAHPREALVVQLKQDRQDEDSTKPFSDLITDAFASKSKYWRLFGSTPCLGELRGKIQLLRRFSGPRLYAYGINVTKWQDNPPIPFTIHTFQGVQLTIQDHYKFPDPESLLSLVTRKGGEVAEMLERAAADPNLGHWYINFSSAFEFNIYHQIAPREIAIGGYSAFRWVDGINLRLLAYLKQKSVGKRRYGVVVMDFPEKPAAGLIRAVVESNFPAKKGEWRRNLLASIAFPAVIVFLCLVMAAAFYLDMHRSEHIGGHWCPRLLHACSLKEGH